MTSEGRPDVIPWVNSVFEQPWWLDAVAPGAWTAATVQRDGQVVARLPFVRSHRFGLDLITQPGLTQTLGPWLAPSAGRYANRLDSEKKLLTALIEELPRFDHFRMNFSPSLTNWLPFYWAGFQASVRYTYRIDDLSDLDRVRGGFQEHVRRGIRKAEASLAVDPDFPLEKLIELDARTYARQGHRPPQSADFISRLDAACSARGARRILGAVDSRGAAHAALFVVWDEHALYAILNARDPAREAFGANTLLYWEAIRLAAEVSAAFDFEGSMIQPIEHFFRGFGGRQTPYLSVWKTSPKAQLALAARSIATTLRQARARRRGSPASQPEAGGVSVSSNPAPAANDGTITA